MVNHTTTTTRDEVKASLAEQRLHRVDANVIHTNSSVERKGRGGGITVLVKEKVGTSATVFVSFLLLVLLLLYLRMFFFFFHLSCV